MAKATEDFYAKGKWEKFEQVKKKKDGSLNFGGYRICKKCGGATRGRASAKVCAGCQNPFPAAKVQSGGKRGRKVAVDEADAAKLLTIADSWEAEPPLMDVIALLEKIEGADKGFRGVRQVLANQIERDEKRKLILEHSTYGPMAKAHGPILEQLMRDLPLDALKTATAS